MFCDQCGAPLAAGQGRCGRCGKAFVASAVGTSVQTRSRVREHVRLLGILWIAYSALHIFAGVGALVFAKFIAIRIFEGAAGPPPEFLIWLRPLIGVIGWLILAKAAVGIMTGWGLLRREEWARVFTIVMGFLALLSVPIGTALGIYTLWVLLPSASEEEYKSMAQAA